MATIKIISMTHSRQGIQCVVSIPKELAETKEQARDLLLGGKRTAFGIEIVENDSLAPGTAYVVQNKKRVGAIVNIDSAHATAGDFKDAMHRDAQRREPVDIDAHQRALNTPFFNDLAG